MSNYGMAEKIMKKQNCPKELKIVAIIMKKYIKKCFEFLSKMHMHYKVAQKLAGFFHSWWNLGNGDLSARIICMDNLHATKFRLKIVESIMNIINIGMRLIAVEVLEKM